MNKSNFIAIINKAKIGLKKHSPEILTGAGIAGLVTTTVMAVKATPKALVLIHDAQEIKYDSIVKDSENIEEDSSLTIFEVVKATWKCYIPATITGITSIACLIGASSINVRRNAALAMAYTLSESALKEYKDKVIETIGEKKEQTVRDAIAKDKINKDPVTNKEVIITNKGDTLCYDATSGRYFMSDIDKLRKVENDLNKRMRDEMSISLNEFYSEIGLTSTAIGDELGWHIDKGYIELEFSSQLANNDTPCLVINYRIAPQYGYWMR